MTTRQHPHKSTFIDPRSLVFWVGLALLVFGVIHLQPLVMKVISDNPTVMAFTTVLWAVYAIVFGWIIYRLEMFQRRSMLNMLGAFVWGFFVVTGIALGGGNQVDEIVGKLLGPDLQDWVPAIAAPLVEEPLKMLGVIALAFIPGARINSALDGLFYGLWVGLGFEVAESILYGAQAGSTADLAVSGVVASFVLRGIVGGLWSHPTYTGITGAGVGYFFGSGASALKRWLVMLGALVSAMVLHGFFDSPLLEFDNPLISTVVKGLPALILLLVLLRLARRRERVMITRIGETEVPTDLVSHEELETLLTRKGRRTARKPIRRQHGHAAAHAMKRLQRSQVELIEAIADTGEDSDESRAYAAEVQEDRRVLLEVTATS